MYASMKAAGRVKSPSLRVPGVLFAVGPVSS